MSPVLLVFMDLTGAKSQIFMKKANDFFHRSLYLCQTAG